MGRSEPTFVVKECTNTYYNYTGWINDYNNETKIRAAAALIEKRNKGCWNYEGFRLPEPNGPKTYHFLEYSGRTLPNQALTCISQYPHLLRIVTTQVRVKLLKTWNVFASCSEMRNSLCTVSLTGPK
jgi:hypothetical protein